MELAAVNSPATAFLAGLITSLHCVGMCGPLACALMPVKGDRSDPHTVSTTYHLARLTGYAALGAVAGGLGRMPLSWVSGSALRWLPWVLVLYFVAMALRWDR
ncbi:MAG: sulfite exporter TauE/SafE family protein, partial [Opitutaceae bacterium]